MCLVRAGTQVSVVGTETRAHWCAGLSSVFAVNEGKAMWEQHY